MICKPVIVAAIACLPALACGSSPLEEDRELQPVAPEPVSERTSEPPEPGSATSSGPDLFWIDLRYLQTAKNLYVEVRQSGLVLSRDQRAGEIRTREGKINNELRSEAFRVVSSLKPFSSAGRGEDLFSAKPRVSVFRQIDGQVGSFSALLNDCPPELQRLIEHLRTAARESPVARGVQAFLKSRPVESARLERIRSDPRHLYKITAVDVVLLQRCPAIEVALNYPGRLVAVRELREYEQIELVFETSNPNGVGPYFFVSKGGVTDQVEIVPAR